MLKGEKCYLRAIEPEDLEVLYRWENDPEIWLLSNTLVPFSKMVLSAYLETVHLDIFTTKQIRFMICLLDNTPVGCIDLFDYEPLHKRAGIGILIAAASNRNKGIASDALKIMKNYCKQTLLLHQVYCNVGVGNASSIQLFEKGGFIKSGFKKDWVLTTNGYTDEYFYQCILV
ncbi:MAG TPA: GNAT family N-acetyltransferase [Bacteroidia bacterium]|nr:GNAT family N-acetyltransferase [Bacteroidia bacterium]HRH07897.1 GNAT family N-acetyltransferase [Bacteroidia bacterium]HRH62227.1 GNAT family N-acetyltransferase [Bacteroidia bacterium]